MISRDRAIRLAPIVAILVLAIALAAAPARALELHWDGNGPTPPNLAGGSGTWNADSLNWFNGTAHQAYSAGAPHDTVFGVAGGSVNIAAPLTVRSLRFDVPGYVLSGSPLSLEDAGEGSHAITVVEPAHSASISAALQGSAGLVKQGDGTLVLSGSNTFAGLTVRGGTVSIAADAALGDVASTVTLDGGTLRVTGGSSVSTAATRPFVIGSDGAPFDIQNTSSTGLTLRGVLSGIGMLTKTGSGTLRLDATNNMFVGGVTIQGGTLRFNNNDLAGPKALRLSPIIFAPSAGSALFSLGGSSDVSELRSGEWLSASPGAGSIVAATTSTDPAVGASGHDLLVHVMADATFSGTVANLATSNGGVLGPDSSNGKFGVRGIAVQTLSGTTQINETVSVYGLAGLRLSGSAALTGSSVTVNLNGGTLILDNATTNLADRFNNAGSVEPRGGGRFVLAGHAAGSSETVGLLQLSTATGKPDSGSLRVEIVHRAGGTAATQLQFAGMQRTSGRATVDFSASDAGGAAIALGQAGNAPRVLFAAAPALAASGLFSGGGTGWATVNASDFATYDPTTGVKAVGAVAFASAGANDNALLTGSAVLSGATTKTVASLKIAPVTGQTLDFEGSASLETTAMLLAGPHDFLLRNASGGSGQWLASADRYVHVEQAALRVGVPIAGSGGVVKSGGGTLVLTATNSYSGPTTINQGAVRATPGVSLGAGVLELRGGVLEITGGGVFNRHLDYGVPSGPGRLSWTAVVGLPSPGISKEDRGSGGFAAVGSDVTVDLNGLGPSDIVWEDPAFLSTGYALVLGSRNADARVTLVDNFGLGLSPAAYNVREFRVIDNPNATADVARLAGIIFSDSAANNGMLTDLLKTGDGTLELTGNNTYIGGTIIAEGTVLLGHANALGRPAPGAYVLLGTAGGSASAGVLSSVPLSLDRDIAVPTGGAGYAALGTTAAGESTFAGKIVVGANQVQADKELRLHADAGGEVAFSGGIDVADGYTGRLTVRKTGEGTVVLDMANTYSGEMIVAAGTLELAAPGALPYGSDLTILAGARVEMRAGLGSPAAPSDLNLMLAEAVVVPADSSPGLGSAAAVPEPSTWLLMLAALLAAGAAAAMRRRPLP